MTILKEPPESRNPFKDELERWMERQNAGHLRDLYIVFKNHRDYLNSSALNFLSTNKIDQARMERAKAEDMDKIIDLIKDRIKECANEANKKRG